MVEQLSRHSLSTGSFCWCCCTVQDDDVIYELVKPDQCVQEGASSASEDFNHSAAVMVTNSDSSEADEVCPTLRAEMSLQRVSASSSSCPGSHDEGRTPGYCVVKQSQVRCRMGRGRESIQLWKQNFNPPKINIFVPVIACSTGLQGTFREALASPLFHLPSLTSSSQFSTCHAAGHRFLPPLTLSAPYASCTLATYTVHFIHIVP